MAEQYPEVPLPLSNNAIETLINKKFDQLIGCLNSRREQLISEHRGRQEERRTKTAARDRTLKQLTNSKALVQTELKDNVLISVQHRAVEELEAKMRQLEFVEREVELIFDCDTKQLEESISVLGQLVERDTLSIPNYPRLRQFQTSVGKRGKGLENLYWPRGIAFDEITQHIYVANAEMHIYPTVGGIKVFSVTGEYINTFCKGQLTYPVGIAIFGDEVFVSDSYLHSILHFKLPGFQLVNKVGKKGNGKGEFSFPRQLTVAPNGSLFVADRNNNRIVVMNEKLEFQQSISHPSIRQPFDVKLLDNKIFVLSYRVSPCVLTIW